MEAWRMRGVALILLSLALVNAAPFTLKSAVKIKPDPPVIIVRDPGTTKPRVAAESESYMKERFPDALNNANQDNTSYPLLPQGELSIKDSSQQVAPPLKLDGELRDSEGIPRPNVVFGYDITGSINSMEKKTPLYDETPCIERPLVVEIPALHNVEALSLPIVTDGVFSMDGTVAPLEQICDLADKYGALVFLDECHATGMFGSTGRGTPEHCGVEGRVDIINSTMGKALGGAMGGFTTGPKELIDLLRQKARPYLFSNTLAPAIVGGCNKVFDLIKDDSSLVEKLQRNTARFAEGMTAAGFSVGGDPAHPISPVHLGDARLAAEFADEMLQKGIYVIGFSFPVVPKGKARIRTQLSAVHSDEDIDRCVEAFTEIGKAKGVI